MRVTYEDVKRSEEIRTYITQADASLIALGYTVTPDIPQEEFSVRDCAPADPARRKPDAPKDQLGVGTAVLFFASRDGEDPSLRMTASSMRFTPPERVTWRIHFHIVSRGEVTVELPGE